MTTLTGLQTTQATFQFGIAIGIWGAGITKIVTRIHPLTGLLSGALIGSTFTPTLFGIQKLGLVKNNNVHIITFLALEILNTFITYYVSNIFFAPITFTATVVLSTSILVTSLVLWILFGDNNPPSPVLPT